MIFSVSKAPELARSARVCKNWSDPALDELWRDLQSVFPLLQLVMDSELTQTASVGPADLEAVSIALADVDWPRFCSYAKRVQVLYFDDTFFQDSALVEAICLHHPYGPSLLPRLKKLDWFTFQSSPSFIPFISKDLVNLDLQLHDTDEAWIKEIFSALRHRTLKLKVFHLDTEVVGAVSEAALASWLEQMETLESLELPPYYLTERIVTAIGAFPRLRTIDLPFDGPHYQYNDTGFLGTLPGGSFPSLVRLTLPATPAAARHLLFNSPTNYTCLTKLHLYALKDIGAHQILAFTQQLAGRCPMITDIELALFLKPEFRSQGASALPIEVLESLYSCKNLNALRIGHPLPLKLNPADVENIAHAWPQIKDLYLCCQPDFSFSISEQMGTSISILPVFALHLPNLQRLGLYFNGQDPITFEGHLYPQFQFVQLQTLSVGLSPIPMTKVRDLGFYLASLCSRIPNIAFGYFSWLGEMGPPDDVGRKTAWRDVEENMAFAMRVKLAGKS
ncbi:hypothetical protein FRC00_010336 [Tulasnella sp. 408]|nr:hypothetical protein FRC00_010336 [Tulasnella sp. 408]